REFLKVRQPPSGSTGPSRHHSRWDTELAPESDDGWVVIEAVHDTVTVIACEDPVNVAFDVDVRAEIAITAHEWSKVRRRHVSVQPGSSGFLPLVHPRGDHEDGAPRAVVTPDLVEHRVMWRAIGRCRMECGEVLSLPHD
uniref:hypothetical protein n=1 Tax=Mycobacteroides abscessus TaxID=36809 RepID=UPI001C256254